MRESRSKKRWQAELDYILSIDPDCPGIAFSYSPASFKRYVVRQAAFCELDGHQDIAELILGDE